MAKARKYIKRMTDRHGHERFYFRRAGIPNETLPGRPGEAAFEAAYAAALARSSEALGETIKAVPQGPPKAPPAPARGGPGSFNDLAARFYRSERFLGLRPITQSTYRNVIERLRAEHGDKPVALLDAKGVKLILAKHAALPGARNQFLKLLRILMDFAIEEKDREDNPCLSIKKLKTKAGGFRAWHEDDIKQFLARHEPGSKAYLALALALYTGQRRSDLGRMSWRMVRRGRICLTQSKTGAYLEISVAPTLAAILDAHCPRDAGAFLRTEYGQPFAPAGFGNWFRDRCDEAGLPLGFNSHGLRKAVCRRLAEAGCTVHEIAAISGHKSLSEIERYTKAASQRLLADQAMNRLGEGLPKGLPEPEGPAPQCPVIPRIFEGVALPREIQPANDNSGLPEPGFARLPVDAR